MEQNTNSYSINCCLDKSYLYKFLLKPRDNGNVRTTIKLYIKLSHYCYEEKSDVKIPLDTSILISYYINISHKSKYPIVKISISRCIPQALLFARMREQKLHSIEACSQMTFPKKKNTKKIQNHLSKQRRRGDWQCSVALLCFFPPSSSSRSLWLGALHSAVAALEIARRSLWWAMLRSVYAGLISEIKYMVRWWEGKNLQRRVAFFLRMKKRASIFSASHMNSIVELFDDADKSIVAPVVRYFQELILIRLVSVY